MTTDQAIQHEVDALKSRVGETRALYREVCALLFFRFGITPTVSKLYQYVRRGSMNVPSEELRNFWVALRERSRVDLQHPGLPDSLKDSAAEAIATLWRQAIEAARAELAAERLQLQLEAETARAAREASDQALAVMEATAEQLRSDIARLQREKLSVLEELQAAQRAHSGSEARIQQMQVQLEEAATQRAAIQDGLVAELAKAREAAEAANERAAGAERRALKEIEAERQARARAESAAEAARQKLATVHDAARNQAAQQAAEMARISIALEQSTTALDGARRSNEQLTDQLAALKARLAAAEQLAMQHEAEAKGLRSVVDRLAPASAAKAGRPPRRTKSPETT